MQGFSRAEEEHVLPDLVVDINMLLDSRLDAGEEAVKIFLGTIERVEKAIASSKRDTAKAVARKE